MMVQANKALATPSQDQANVLTELIQQLLGENKLNLEPEDLYFTKIIPVTHLTAYPGLIEALSSIRKYFYCSPLTEEERKIAILSFPKTSSIN
ncbi:hypothetical protein AYI69_g4278 [Smittium culicis]|uniref:Uncharacterized protein n=1 Tax=Smittium culicis TaxID=133412 RepID=A0A1R1YF11_9FUNG|nr:hypothetical protein AYI69_g4278 [Smittium culicis]